MTHPTPVHRLLPLRLRAVLRFFGITRILAVGLSIAAIFSGITTYGVITQSTNPFGPDPRHVLGMVIVNLGLVLALAGVISYKFIKLWVARKRGNIGSRLQTRMVMMFCLVAILPTVIITTFSGVFFNIGIQSWFNDRISLALEDSMAVADGYLKEHKDNIRADILAMANDVNRNAGMMIQNQAQFKQFLATQATLRNLSEALVFRGRDVLARTEMTLSLLHDLEELSPQLLEKASEGEVVILTSENDERVRALIKLNALYDVYLLVGRNVDSKVLEHVTQTSGAVTEYERLRDNISTIQIYFFMVFIGVALLLLLAAIWAGLILSGEIIQPLGALIAATEKVKSGQLNARVPEGHQHDEIGTLGRAFNEMTDQLKKQRKQLVEANRQTESRRRLMEAVLSGVEAGVVAISPLRQVTLFNRAAPEILGMQASRLKGMDIFSLIPESRTLLERSATAKEKVVQDQLVIDRGRRKTFLVRVVREELQDAIEGYVITFDDITDLLAAQRTAAWGDVARRIAHEIKNPLTPITLATERLKRKYSGMFEATERENYERYIDTISRHVHTIRSIVDEFVNFARMPAPVLAKLDIAAFVREIWLADKALHTHIAYTLHAKDSLALWVNADAGQMNQVFTNLLKNAREALEARMETGKAHSPALTFSMSKHEGSAALTLEDNGTGFPADLIDRITEPYITTREKGTGLGLAIVKKVITDHEGTLHIENIVRDGTTLGARVMVVLPLVTPPRTS